MSPSVASRQPVSGEWHLCDHFFSSLSRTVQFNSGWYPCAGKSPCRQKFPQYCPWNGSSVCPIDNGPFSSAQGRSFKCFLFAGLLRSASFFKARWGVLASSFRACAGVLPLPRPVEECFLFTGLLRSASSLQACWALPLCRPVEECFLFKGMFRCASSLQACSGMLPVCRHVEECFLYTGLLRSASSLQACWRVLSLPRPVSKCFLFPDLLRSTASLQACRGALPLPRPVKERFLFPGLSRSASSFQASLLHRVMSLALCLQGPDTYMQLAMPSWLCSPDWGMSLHCSLSCLLFYRYQFVCKWGLSHPSCFSPVCCALGVWTCYFWTVKYTPVFNLWKYPPKNTYKKQKIINISRHVLQFVSFRVQNIPSSGVLVAHV